MSFLDFLSKPTRPLVGLDISSSAIKLIELSKSADGYKVEAYRVMALPANTMVEKNIADIPALADTLEKLVASSGTKLTDTAVAVSGSSVITKEIELPAGLADLQMEMQIEVEADQYIPYPMEEVNGTEKVPMLGDIPFLGKLFRNELRNIEKREILIITPKIINDDLLDR